MTVRPQPAQPSPSKAIVLGPRGVSDAVARELRDEGIEPVLSNSSLPWPGHPDGLERLRQELALFAGGAKGVRLVHPGACPWAERPELPTLCEELGLTAVTPPARMLSLLSDRLNLFSQAEGLGIPNLLIASDPMYSVREVNALMEGGQLRFPLVLKSVRGGEQGLYVAQDPEDLEKRLPLWFEQLRGRFGEVIFFAERYLEGARQITVPFARFAAGGIRVFPTVDGSLQSRHRKIVEFCPAAQVDAPLLEKLTEWTVALAEKFHYVGVGTFEFLLDGDRAFLIDCSARLEPGFRLWSVASGASAVAWQLATLQFPEIPRRLAGKTAKREAGAAVHLMAEDPILQLPQPGHVSELSTQRDWVLPGAVAELNLAAAEGDEVSPSGTGYLGTLSVWAGDSKKALTVLRGILEQLWIAGTLQTNERFLSELLAHPWVREGMFHAGFVDEEFLPAVRPPEEIAQAAVSVAATAAGPSVAGQARWAAGDLWAKPHPSLKWKTGPKLRGGGASRAVSGEIELGEGATLRVCAEPQGERWQVRLGQWMLSVRRVATDAGARRSPRVLALVPGKVHSIWFREGAVVPAHEPLLMIESLGALIPHALPAEARVVSWNVQAEQSVHSGQELGRVELLPKA